MDFDSSDFEKIFMERFDYKYISDKAILRDEVRPGLLKYFPIHFIRKEFQVAKHLLKLAIENKRSCYESN